MVAPARQAQTDVVILDDGMFYIDLNCNYSPALAPGFLQHRCYVGVTTPGGYECVGSFDQKHDGMWEASIDIEYDHETESDARILGRFPTRLDAIAALWAARHQAHCRHAN